MAEPRRWGFTLPLSGVTLAEHRDVLEEAERLGYTDAWTLEIDGTDAVTPLALAAAWTSNLRLGTAIISSFTRGPALIASTALALAEAAPGRVVLGLGSSSDTIVRDWNGGDFERPLARTRDVLLLVREALSGARVSRTLPAAAMTGYRYSRPLPPAPPIYLAALRSGMLRLAGELADGVILNWLRPDDVPAVTAIVREAAERAGRDPAAIEVVARIFVFMHDDIEQARATARRAVAAYLNVPVYRAFHEWLGNGPLLSAMWERWQAGDRRGALAAISDDALDQLVAVGDAARCRQVIERFVAQGVACPALMFWPVASEPAAQAAQSLAMLRAFAPGNLTT